MLTRGLVLIWATSYLLTAAGSVWDVTAGIPPGASTAWWIAIWVFVIATFYGLAEVWVGRDYGCCGGRYETLAHRFFRHSIRAISHRSTTGAPSARQEIQR